MGKVSLFDWVGNSAGDMNGMNRIQKTDVEWEYHRRISPTICDAVDGCKIL